MVSPDLPYLRGIDVSHYQGEIDWEAVARSGVAFAFVKASEGRLQSPQAFQDPRFQANAAALNDLTRQGLALPWGAYHFARPQYSAARQAEFFAPLALLAPLPPALDLEDSGGLTPAGLASWTLSFLQTLEALTGRRPILYTNVFYGGQVRAVAGRCRLWIANPGAGGAPHPGTAPSMPPGWEAWDFWQYCWRGSVPGINGRVDLNYFRGRQADLQALCAGREPLPALSLQSLDARLRKVEQALGLLTGGSADAAA